MGGTTVLTRARVQPPLSVAARSASSMTAETASSTGDTSEFQPFPGSAILEAWLPLALCLIAGVRVPAESFASNQTGAAWAAVLRIAVFAAIYFLLVAPITFFAVKLVFAKKRRYLPPQPRWRVIATFLFPATLAYVFSTLNGVIGFTIGALLGLLVIATVFWLLFRLQAQDSANIYAVVGGTCLGAMVLGMLIFAGVGALLNQAMLVSKSAGNFKENPLGPQLAWTVPAGRPSRAVP